MLLPAAAAAGLSSAHAFYQKQVRQLALRFQLRLPSFCSRLMAAADAALATASSAQLAAALPPLLDAAGVACKLLRLACSDAVHATMPGVRQAVLAVPVQRGGPARGAGAEPYSPVPLMLAAVEAAARCAARLLAWGAFSAAQGSKSMCAGGLSCLWRAACRLPLHVLPATAGALPTCLPPPWLTAGGCGRCCCSCARLWRPGPWQRSCMRRGSLR